MPLRSRSEVHVQVGPTDAGIGVAQLDLAGARQARRHPWEARPRLLEAALDLFAENGVSGTSLQMIAGRLGVTKSAVYHQFPAKEEIVIALVDPSLEQISRTLDEAERQRTLQAREDAFIEGLAGLVVCNRQGAALLQGDPALPAIMRGYEPYQRVIERVTRVMLGAARLRSTHHEHSRAGVTATLLRSADYATTTVPAISSAPSRYVRTSPEEATNT